MKYIPISRVVPGPWDHVTLVPGPSENLAKGPWSLGPFGQWSLVPGPPFRASTLAIEAGIGIVRRHEEETFIKGGGVIGVADYAITPKHPSNYAITPKYRIDYAIMTIKA